jgi:hypothetical protein
MNIPENLKLLLENLIVNAKKSVGDVKNVALSQAWTLLQLMVAEIIQAIEANCPTLAGKDKKELAMTFLSTFYDSVFVIVNIPFVPAFLQPIIHKYVKSLLMILVGATIDAMVTTFRNTGVFTTKDK